MLSPEQEAYIRNVRKNLPKTDTDELVTSLREAEWDDAMIAEALKIFKPKRYKKLIVGIVATILLVSAFAFVYYFTTSNKRIINKDLAVKNNTLFCRGVAVDVSDPNSIEYLSGFYIRDKDYYYADTGETCGGLAASVAEAELPCGCTFVQLFPVDEFVSLSDDGYTITSKEAVYKHGHLSGGGTQLKTPKGFDSDYYRTTLNIHWHNDLGSLVQEADLETFTALGNNIAKDKNFAYFSSSPWKPADIDSLDMLYDRYYNLPTIYVADKENVYYYMGNQLEQVDRASFSPILDDVGTDSSRVYVRGMVVYGLSPAGLRPAQNPRDTTSRYLTNGEKVYVVADNTINEVPGLDPALLTY